MSAHRRLGGASSPVRLMAWHDDRFWSRNRGVRSSEIIAYVSHKPPIRHRSRWWKFTQLSVRQLVERGKK